MMLVERDKLDLNDPIARHLPSPARLGIDHGAALTNAHIGTA